MKFRLAFILLAIASGDTTIIGIRPATPAQGAPTLTDLWNGRATWVQDANKLGSDFGFHYDPYNFDSNPEKSFFEEMLRHLNLNIEEVEDIYFTGTLTDPAKTDFFIEYKDEKGKWRRYTPDFLIRKKPGRGRRKGTGRVYIVEIKREHDRGHSIDGETGRKALAVRAWEKLNPDQLRYEMIFTDTESVNADDTKDVQTFIEAQDK